MQRNRYKSDGIDKMKESQRQLQKNSTRQHITETAIQEYGKNGFARTRTSDIAKAANVSHGTVFAHFSTQEELLTAVIDEFGSRINFRLHELACGKSSLYEVLEAHVRGLVEFEDFYTRLVIENRLLPEEVRNTFIMIQSTVSFHLSQVAEQEMKAGTILTLPVHMIFNGWIGLLHYYLANGDLFSPGESVLKRHGKDLIHYYTGLLARANRQSS